MKFTKKFKGPELSKKEKVLFKLMANMEEGVLSFDLQKVGGYRYSSRIFELRKQDGYNIISIPEKTKSGAVGCRYFLKG